MFAKVQIRNARNGVSGYIVASVCDCELWFYGAYESEERAKEVAKEIGGIDFEKWKNLLHAFGR